MNENELYHSDIYLGQDFSDGIRHWKYIKRERKNGRWVYYYSHEEYNKAKNNYNNAEKEYTKAQKKTDEAFDKHNKLNWDATGYKLGYQINKEVSKGEKNPISKFKMKLTMNKNAKKLKELTPKLNKAKQEYDKAKSDEETKFQQLDKSFQQYNKISKKTKTQRTLGEATVGVANAVSNASYNIKKNGKKTVDKAVAGAFGMSVAEYKIKKAATKAKIKLKKAKVKAQVKNEVDKSMAKLHGMTVAEYKLKKAKDKAKKKVKKTVKKVKKALK